MDERMDGWTDRITHAAPDEKTDGQTLKIRQRAFQQTD